MFNICLGVAADDVYCAIICEPDYLYMLPDGD